MSACVKNNHLQTTSRSIDATLSAAFNHVQGKATQRRAPRALINSFMSKLLITDRRQSARAIMPLVHKSNYSADKRSLDSDLLRFSFKKAHANAKFYQYPVKITRTATNNTTALGHKSRGTAEAGHEINYYLAKKPGVGGVPAPLTVFFPKNGGAPTISYMGSL